MVWLALAGLVYAYWSLALVADEAARQYEAHQDQAALIAGWEVLPPCLV